MSPVDQVVSNILARENMPVPKDIGDGEVTWAGGQTTVWCDQYRLPYPQDEVMAAKNLTDWLIFCGFVQIINRSLPLGDCVSDWAYNSDVMVAVKALQSALGVTADGWLGPIALKALADWGNYADLTRTVAEARIAFIQAEVAAGRIKAQFEQGLVNRAESFL